MAFPLMAAAGLALSAASGIGNWISGNKYQKKLDRMLNLREKRANDAYNNAVYDPTQSSAARWQTTMADKAYQDTVQSVNNQVSANGGLNRAQTLESVNNARAQQAGAIAATADQQRREALQQKQSALDNIDNARMGLAQQRAENNNAAWSSLGQAGGQLMAMDSQMKQLTGKGALENGGKGIGGFDWKKADDAILSLKFDPYSVNGDNLFNHWRKRNV